MLQNGATPSNRAPLKSSALPDQAGAFQIVDMAGRFVDKFLLSRFWGNYSILQLKRDSLLLAFFFSGNQNVHLLGQITCSTG